MGPRTHDALMNLRGHLCEMMETVELALNGSQEALTHIWTEYHGAYTKCSTLAGEVAGAIQYDDDEAAEQYADNEAAEAEYQKELEREEARRACGP